MFLKEKWIPLIYNSLGSDLNQRINENNKNTNRNLYFHSKGTVTVPKNNAPILTKINNLN